jgi:uncharacterized protein YkwD
MRYIISVLALIMLLGTLGCQPQYRDRYDREYNRYDSYRRDDQYRKLDLNEVFLRYHNEIRRKCSLTDLQINADLGRAAQKHAEWMSTCKKSSHLGENESMVKDRVNGNWRYLGENIAFGYRDESEAMQAWLDSSDHYENIIKREHKYAGFGVAETRDGTLYWCVVFGS